MEITKAFLIRTIDTVRNNIAVVDGDFNIVFTNKVWDEFGVANGCLPTLDWKNVNYYTPCLLSAQDGDEFCIKAIKLFDKLKKGLIREFQLEYPCHSPDEDRWFNMEVSQLTLNNDIYYVISHQNITARVALEQQARELSRMDGLTGVNNRRAFDDFFDLQWHHCLRNNLPLTLAMVDIDNFKQINDQYGHQVGDKCLQQVAAVISHYTNRASDKCARYGGDEFAVVWAHCEHDKAVQMSHKILAGITNTRLNSGLKSQPVSISISIGLFTSLPALVSLEAFITKAGKLMYSAKAAGKSTVVDSQLMPPNRTYNSTSYLA